MNLEGFGKRGMELGDDPEGIKETKNPLHEEYLSLIDDINLIESNLESKD